LCDIYVYINNEGRKAVEEKKRENEEEGREEQKVVKVPLTGR
jgi:hypothetical protein